MAVAVPHVAEDRLERVYVWELPVRVIHWVIVFALVVLSVTGYYLHDPFIVSRGQGVFLLAWMRFTHEVTGFVFTIAVLARLYWMFVGNRWAHWRAFLPLTRAQWEGITGMFRYYTFLRWRPPAAVGHNALAALAYLGIYALCLFEALTGFALFAVVVGTEPWTTAFGWVTTWLSIPYTKLIHYLGMYLLIGFTIHHVYSALLVSVEEKNGELGSIFSGYKFVSSSLLRGQRPPGAPQPEPARERAATRPEPGRTAPAAAPVESGGRPPDRAGR